MLPTPPPSQIEPIFKPNGVVNPTPEEHKPQPPDKEQIHTQTQLPTPEEETQLYLQKSPSTQDKNVPLRLK